MNTDTQMRRRQEQATIEALKQDQDVLNAIMEHTHVCLAYLDKQFNFLRVNSACVEQWRHPREELLGRNYFELFPNEENRAIFEQVRDSGEPFTSKAQPCQYIDQTEQGITYWNWTLEPVKNAAGDVQGMVLSLLDVTETIQAEQALAISEERLRLVAEYTYDWECWTDPEGNHRYVSPSCERITGYPPERFYQDPDLLYRIVHPEDQFILAEHMEERPQGHRVRGIDYRIVTRDGEERWINHVCQPVYSADGIWLGYRSSNRDITQRKRIEREREALLEELKAERARLTAVLESAPEGIVVIDKQVQLVLANPAAELLYACPLAPHQDDDGPVLPQSFYADGRPCDLYEMDFLRPALEGEILRGVELIIVGPRDQRCELLLNAAPIRDGRDEIIGAVGVFQDITERKQAERALQDSESKLQALFEVLPVGISILDKDRNLRLTNPALARILDLSQEQLENGKYKRRTYFRADGREMSPDEFPSNQAFREQRPVFDVEIGIVKQDRTKIWTNVSAVPVPFEDWRVILTTADITRQKEVEEALREAHDDLDRRVKARTAELVKANAALREENAERRRIESELRVSEERFRQVADHIDEILWLSQPQDGRILYINPAYERILGHAYEENMLSIKNYVHPEDRARVSDDLVRIGKGQESEFRIVRPDGSVRWLRARAFPILDETGQLYRLAGVAQDITEQKLALDSLVDAEQLAVVGKMASSLIHEINNPLQAAIGCLELAQEQLEKGNSADSYFQVTTEALERASRIVNQLRTLRQRTQYEDKENVDPSVLLEKVLRLTEKQCQNCHVELEWQTTAELPVLHLMPNGMQQVFLNLVLNALDAMPDGGRLRISASPTQEPQGVQIQFKDEGPGVPPDKAEMIFEPFYTTKKDSLGLGLFISQNIVQQHGGRIELTSQEGEGAIFTVWLPLDDLERERQDPAPLFHRGSV